MPFRLCVFRLWCHVSGTRRHFRPEVVARGYAKSSKTAVPPGKNAGNGATLTVAVLVSVAPFPACCGVVPVEHQGMCG